jgi:hypothetical protein
VRFLHISCFLLLGLVACSKSLPEAREAPSGIGLETQLAEAGSEPREKLRYKRAPGLGEDLVIEFGLASLLETTTEAALVTPPVLSLGLNVKTAKCDGATCSYAFEFRVIGVKMPAGSTEEDSAKVAAAVSPLGQVTGVFEVDDRGVTKNAQLNIPPGTPPRLLALIGNVRTSLVSVPLPDEAVGIGAKWKVERLHTVGPIKTTQIVSYSLLERQGRILRLGVTLQQTAAPQTVPGDVSLNLETYEVSGTGSMLMNLDGITPLTEMHATSTLRGSLVKGDKSEPVQASGVLDMVVAPVRANTAAAAAQ